MITFYIEKLTVNIHVDKINTDDLLNCVTSRRAPSDLIMVAILCQSHVLQEEMKFTNVDN